MRDTQPDVDNFSRKFQRYRFVIPAFAGMTNVLAIPARREETFSGQQGGRRNDGG
jgi:hypothetical protein